MHEVQKVKLLDAEEQKESRAQDNIEKVLQMVQKAHRSQRSQEVSQSNGQSNWS